MLSLTFTQAAKPNKAHILKCSPESDTLPLRQGPFFAGKITSVGGDAVIQPKIVLAEVAQFYALRQVLS